VGRQQRLHHAGHSRGVPRWVRPRTINSHHVLMLHPPDPYRLCSTEPKKDNSCPTELKLANPIQESNSDSFRCRSSTLGLPSGSFAPEQTSDTQATGGGSSRSHLNAVAFRESRRLAKICPNQRFYSPILPNPANSARDSHAMAHPVSR